MMLVIGDIVVWAVGAAAVVEGAGPIVLWVLLTRSRGETAELRRRLDARQRLILGGRDAVKTVWETANLVRRQGFGAAVRTSIEICLVSGFPGAGS